MAVSRGNHLGCHVENLGLARKLVRIRDRDSWFIDFFENMRGIIHVLSFLGN